MAVQNNFPKFKYHPNLYELGILDRFHGACECCGEETGANWIRIMGGKKVCLDCYETYNRFDV